MDRFTDSQSVEAPVNNALAGHIPALLNTFDSAPQAKTSSQEKLLPSLELAKDDFSKTAKAAFKFVDANGDGKLTIGEVDRAFRMPVAGESKEIIESIRIMHDKFEFLAHLRAEKKGSFDITCVITAEGLDKAQGVLNGKVGNEPLTHLHRNWFSSRGELAGLVATIPGYMVGTGLALGAAEAVGAGTALTYGAVAVGALAGFAIPIAAGAAIGYGLGYLYDKHEAKKQQKTEINAFLREFQK